MKLRAKRLVVYLLVTLLICQSFGSDALMVLAEEITFDESMEITTDSSDDYVYLSGGEKTLTVSEGVTLSGRVDFLQATASSVNILNNNGTIIGDIKIGDSAAIITNNGTISGNISMGESTAQITNNGTISSSSFDLKTGSILNNTGKIEKVTVNGGELNVTGGEVGTINDSLGSYISLSGCTVGSLTTPSKVSVAGIIEGTSISVGGFETEGNATINVLESINIAGDVSDVAINIQENTNLANTGETSYSVNYDDKQYMISAGKSGTILDLFGKRVSVVTPENSHITYTGVSDTAYLPGDMSAQITLKVEEGYYFPEDYCSKITHDGAGTLNTTRASDSEVTISYTLGETESEDITITLVAATQKPKEQGTGFITVSDIYYGAKVKAVLTSATNDINTAKVEYKKKDAADSEYSTKEPTKIGSYTARATFTESATHMGCVATTDFNISYLPLSNDLYVIKGNRGENGFYISKVQIIPKKGYSVANKLDGTYKDKLTFTSSQDESKLYFIKDETGEKTNGKKLSKIKIDLKLPEMSAVHGSIYYGETYTVDVSDANLSEVKCNDINVKVSDNKAQLILDSNHGFSSYCIYAKDLAGNSRQIDIIVADEWLKTGIIPANRLVRLSTGKAYRLDSGTWKVVGDATQYAGSQEVYIRSGGEYTFGQE